MRRHLSWIFASTMLLGGLAACSDDDDDSGDDDTEETTTTDGGGDDSGDSGDGGNAEVQAYCDDVDAFVDAVTDAGSDPAALAGLSEEGAALSESAADLAGEDLDESDVEALNECTQAASDALQDLIPGG